MNAYFAEFFGTALLILLGNGVVANVCLNKTKGQSSGWIVILPHGHLRCMWRLL